MEETLLTVQQAAAELGVTDGAVRLALSQGRLSSVEKFGRKLIERADMDAYKHLDAYKQRTQPDGVKKAGRPWGGPTDAK
jgi:excisionase family DNA binding protein